MGGTGWFYFTPYQPDVEAALQTLRKEVFERCEFGKVQRTDAFDNFPGVTPQIKAAHEKAREKLREAELEKWGKKPEEFESIEELIEASGENGTHSILDIFSASNGPGINCAWPAPEEEIEATYGTPQPTHEEVEAKACELTERMGLERWKAIYFVIYEDGKPAEYYFEGSSGD